MSILIPSSGGGAPSYISGTEILVDLSAQAGVSFPMTVAHVGKTVILYSSVEGQSFKLLAANTGGALTVGKGLGFRVMPGSKPIRIYNGGTAGTDPVLEAFLLPGTDCALFLQSASVPSVTAGTWKGRGYGMFHGGVPVSLPGTVDPGVDFGSVILTGSIMIPGNLLPNVYVTRLSSTLYVVASMPNNQSSIVAYAVSYNHATDAWTWGTPVTALTSANAWYYPNIIAINSTTFAITAFEGTASKQSIRAATVSGTTITQGTTLQSGSWTVNPSTSAGAASVSLVADSASSFFFVAGLYDGTNFGIEHFSVSGTTLTRDGGLVVANPGTGQQPNGFSPSANVVDLAIPSDGATYGISRYTYAAGSITNTWNRRNRFGITLKGTLYCADATNRVYYTSDNSNLMRFVLNAGGTDFTENENLGLPVVYSGAGPSHVVQSRLNFISDSEALALTYVVNASFQLTLFDPTISMRARAQFGPGSTDDNGASSTIVVANSGFGPATRIILSLDVNASNRRVAMFHTVQSQAVASDRAVAMHMFDLPRNYDQATQ